MEIVVDSNIIFSAMISDSATREVLLNSGHNFYSPDFIRSEIAKHQELITEKSGLNSKEFEVLLNLILEEIEIQALEEYEDKLEEARNLLAEHDVKDVPFLAVALSKDCKIWSDDKDLQEQEEVEVLTTEEIIKNH